MDRVGFEPTTSAMPMPYPTRLDDRPFKSFFYDFYTLIFVTCKLEIDLVMLVKKNVFHLNFNHLIVSFLKFLSFV